MDHDYTRLLWDESRDIGTFLDEATDVDFDRASLCEDWRVRDVVSLLILGHTAPGPRMFAHIARYGFNLPLDRPRSIPSERLVAAFDALPTIGGFSSPPGNG